ncbi:lprJ, partial [Mycobacterium numidiamassiliense]|jgi:hypothetical protein
VIYAPKIQATTLWFIALTATLAAAAAMLAAPLRADIIRVDIIGNSFLNALTAAGVPYSQPARTTAEGQSVCPMLVQPGGDFDSVVSKMAIGNGMSEKTAGIFTIVAIATYCPAMIAPLIPSRLTG